MISLFLIYVRTKIRVLESVGIISENYRVPNSDSDASSLLMWSFTSKLYLVLSGFRLQQKLEGDFGVHFLFTCP